MKVLSNHNTVVSWSFYSLSNFSSNNLYELLSSSNDLSLYYSPFQLQKYIPSKRYNENYYSVSYAFSLLLGGAPLSTENKMNWDSIFTTRLGLFIELSNWAYMARPAASLALRSFRNILPEGAFGIESTKKTLLILL